MLIDTLPTNLNLHTTDESVAEGVGPCYVVRLRGSWGVDGAEGKGRELHLKVDVVDKVSVTRYSASDLAAACIPFLSEYLKDFTI